MQWQTVTKYWLLSSLVVACATLPVSAKTCEGRMPHWTASNTVPTGTRLQPVNTVEVRADGRLEWNGKEVSEGDVRRFLTIIPTMTSSNITVLKARPTAKCAAVQRLRKTIEKALKCSATTCVEVNG